MRKYKFRSVTDHDFEAAPKVTGIVLYIDQMELDGKVRPYLVVETGISVVRVYQATMLDQLFAAVSSGDAVEIELVKRGRTQSGNALNVFAASLWVPAEEETTHGGILHAAHAAYTAWVDAGRKKLTAPVHTPAGTGKKGGKS